MKVLTGIDIVSIDRFERMLAEGNEALLERIFLPSELESRRAPRLAGVFAAKEAVIKAFSLVAESWHDIEISHEPAGKPVVTLRAKGIPALASCDVSIAHDGGIAAASFVALVA